jgi:cobalt transporter subunit CbtB
MGGMMASTMAVSGIRSAARGGILRGAAFAGALGASLILATGFAGSAFLHNAAHDARHALGFPCH